MSDDLTAKLRESDRLTKALVRPKVAASMEWPTLYAQAADRIDTLTAERDRLREALRSVRSLAARGVVVAICDAALADPEPPTERCTGMTATWCPVHGGCTCDRDDEHDGEVDFASGEGTCPLHALGSDHAADPEPPCPRCGGTGTHPGEPQNDIPPVPCPDCAERRGPRA